MNPYTAPAAQMEQEDRTDPRFAVIGLSGTGRKAFWIVGAVLMSGLAIYSVSLFRRQQSPSLLVTFSPFMVAGCYLFNVAMTFLSDAMIRRKVRRHSIVRSGEALLGSSAVKHASGKEAGHLFLTRTELVFIPGQGNGVEGEPRRYPLGQVESVERLRAFLPMLRNLRLHLITGEKEEWWAPRPARWVREIEEAKSRLL